jgi:hypothetical protein
MRSAPTTVTLGAAAVALLLLAAGCGGSAQSNKTSGEAASSPPATPAAPTCPASWRPVYQRLANQIHADVYCPSWMPPPLTGEIGPDVSFDGYGGSSLSVAKDGSYLALFVWSQPGLGEVHVNLRGYPARTRIPTCTKEDTNGSKMTTTRIPCFADPRGTVHAQGIVATVYTVNQDADLWHVLYAWHHAGGLYTVSQHVAQPLSYAQVVQSLNRILHGLVLVQPRIG